MGTEGVLGLVLDAVSWILLVAGSALVVIGGIGVLRLPDFYTRTHAASLTDTMGAGLIVLGLIVQAGFGLVTAKLVFILLFLWVTTPTAAHALARAALSDGLAPKTDDAGGTPPSKP